MTSPQDYLDLFHVLASRLLRTGTLDVPDLIKLQSCSMLVAIAQKMGDLPANAIDQALLDRVARAVKAMRDVYSSAIGEAHSEKARTTWN